MSVTVIPTEKAARLLKKLFDYTAQEESLRAAHVAYISGIDAQARGFNMLIEGWEVATAQERALEEDMLLNESKIHPHPSMIHILRAGNQWERWESREIQDTLAGAMFIRVDSAIQKLASTKVLSDHLPPEKRLDFGRLFGSVHLAKLIWAAANNLRHADEWPNHDKAEASYSVIEQAGIKPTNWEGQLVSGCVLSIISRDRTHEQVFEDFQQIGRQMTDSPLKKIRTKIKMLRQACLSLGVTEDQFRAADLEFNY